MKRERLSWALGWASMGCGLTELTFPEHIGRVLGAPRHSGLLRSLGLRDVANGLGLLLQPHRREWVWARIVGDALDLALLAVTFRLPRANKVWQGALTLGAIGVALVDLYAATKWSAPLLRSGAVTPSLGMDVGSSGPLESWRGSGLAEDVGVNEQRGEESEPEELRQRRMDEAARALGLPKLDEHGTRQ
ncbi:MAG TPA: hypothetical protein VF794_30385 [Archangium sp.]|jgi:hypothetical protein|uniref:hypothetical protein n=1 Tax=Archangium sp. TaxID=1872627 RepID=UPI002EDAFE8E